MSSASCRADGGYRAGLASSARPHPGAKALPVSADQRWAMGFVGGLTVG